MSYDYFQTNFLCVKISIPSYELYPLVVFFCFFKLVNYGRKLKADKVIKKMVIGFKL